MLVYLKENGYPMSLWIETHDVTDPKEQWSGYESTVTDENGNIVATFTHNALRGRVTWANGFFTALKIKNMENIKKLRKTKKVEMDKCVLCSEETIYPKDMHIDYRMYYVEGAGQVCKSCYEKIYVVKND